MIAASPWVASNSSPPPNYPLTLRAITIILIYIVSPLLEIRVVAAHRPQNPLVLHSSIHLLYMHHSLQLRQIVVVPLDISISFVLVVVRLFQRLTRYILLRIMCLTWAIVPCLVLLGTLQRASLHQTSWTLVFELFYSAYTTQHRHTCKLPHPSLLTGLLFQLISSNMNFDIHYYYREFFFSICYPALGIKNFISKRERDR